MTNLERMQLRTREADEAVLIDCLDSAKNAILSRRFPYGGYPTVEVEVTIPPVTEIDEETGDIIVIEPERTETREETCLEPQYLDLQLRCAIDLYNKIGAEGELAHSENGISRSYESSWISQELLNEIVPFCGVVI